MEKRNRAIVYGVVGACGGAATLASAAGPCANGNCSACFRCFGMGMILVALALINRLRRGEMDRLASKENEECG